MPTIQTSFANQVLSILPGAFQGAYNPRRGSNKFARGLLRAGLMGFKVPSTSESTDRKKARGYPGEVYQSPFPGVAASVNAIGTAVSSATGVKTIGSGVTAGQAGGYKLTPSRKITVTFDASTDWDPSNAVLRGLNQNGQPVSENLAIATSTTATSVNVYSQFTSLEIPAQTGTGGTATVGVAAVAAGALTLADCYGVVIRQPIKTMVNDSNLYVGPTQQNIAPYATGTLAHYVDGDTCPVLQEGNIGVVTEEAVADQDPVYVRIAAGAGGTVLGAFRNDAEGGNCILVPNSRFIGDWNAGVAEAHFASFYA